jgi:hypothetical protein
VGEFGHFTTQIVSGKIQMEGGKEHPSSTNFLEKSRMTFEQLFTQVY